MLPWKQMKISVLIVLSLIQYRDKKNRALEIYNNDRGVIKLERDFSGINCRNTENSATNFDSLNIKPVYGEYRF